MSKIPRTPPPPLSPVNTIPPTPLSLANIKALESDLEKTPVGVNDQTPKIQLCIEIRDKESEKKGKRSSRGSNKSSLELVLELTVMQVKNLPRRMTLDKKKGSGRRPTFVKVQLVPGDVIYSSELKMDKQNEDKVDLNFIEVFPFGLDSLESLKDKKLKVRVCDKKMTRNATTMGEVNIDVSSYQKGKPVCKWFTLESSGQDEKEPAKP